MEFISTCWSNTCVKFRPCFILIKAFRIREALVDFLDVSDVNYAVTEKCGQVQWQFKQLQWYQTERGVPLSFPVNILRYLSPPSRIQGANV